MWVEREPWVKKGELNGGCHRTMWHISHRAVSGGRRGQGSGMRRKGSKEDQLKNVLEHAVVRPNGLLVKTIFKYKNMKSSNEVRNGRAG